MSEPPRTHTKSKVSELRAMSKYSDPSFAFMKIKGGCRFRLLPQNALDCLVYKQGKLMSHGSGGWKSKIRVPAWSLLQTALFCVLTWQRERTSRSLASLFPAYSGGRWGNTVIGQSNTPLCFHTLPPHQPPQTLQQGRILIDIPASKMLTRTEGNGRL